MSLQDALFLVDRGGTNNHSRGSDIAANLVSGDKVLVQRGTGGSTEHFSATWTGSGWDRLQDTDLLIAWDGAENRMVTGSTFKTLFLPAPYAVTPPQIRFTGVTGDYGTLRYEVVSFSTWSRPPLTEVNDNQNGYGKWGYTRDGSYWYESYDDYGSYYFDPNVLSVRYVEYRKFEAYDGYAKSFSLEYPIGEPT